MKKRFALLISAFILVVIYANIDRQALVQHFRQMEMAFFLLALFCFVPQILVTIVRWRWMVSDVCPMGFKQAAQLILAGKALNAFVPSKLGEMSKAYFLKTHADVELSEGMILVVIEKVLDVAGLCAILLVSMIFVPHKGLVEASAALGAVAVLTVVIGLFTIRISHLYQWAGNRIAWLTHLLECLQTWDDIRARWKQQRISRVGMFSLSSLLWLFHLGQIYLFFLALHSTVGPRLVLAYVPLSMFIGLLPLTIGGMGTRDSALILLFAPYENATVMAAIGLLCTMRYWMDTLLGLPFFYQYVAEKNQATFATDAKKVFPAVQRESGELGGGET